MKILCVCQYGHSRSVALARVFHSMGHGAVSIGWATNGGAIECLSDWADIIATLETQYARYVPIRSTAKIVDFNVGADRWVNPYHPELARILTEKVNSLVASGVIHQ